MATIREIALALKRDDRLKFLALDYASELLMAEVTAAQFYNSTSVYNTLTNYASRVMRIDADKRNSEWNALADAAALEITANAVEDITDQDIEAALPTAFELMAGIKQQDKETKISYESEWIAGIKVIAGQRLTYNAETYEVIQEHVTQADWTPDVAKALFRLIQIDAGTGYPIWTQPTGAHDAYALNDIVTHNGANWQSTVDANVWEPGVFGWDELV